MNEDAPKADSDRNGEQPKKRKFEEDTSSLTLSSKVVKEPVEATADGRWLGNNASADAVPKAETVKPEPTANGSGGSPPEVSIKDMAQAEHAVELAVESPDPMATVFQFLIKLEGIQPPIWRRIQVPEYYSLWDLHVAIQAAMGWKDRHLHTFYLVSENGSRMQIGEADEDFQHVREWDMDILDIFVAEKRKALYEYDYGDSWNHTVLLETTWLAEAGVEYPRCIAGERACPPEDCGGAGRYEELLTIMANPAHKEYDETREWLKTVHGLDPWQPESFDPSEVHFHNPLDDEEEGDDDEEEGDDDEEEGDDDEEEGDDDEEEGDDDEEEGDDDEEEGN